MTEDKTAGDAIANHLADTWAKSPGVREQINLLAEISAKITGSRIDGPGGAELKMLILRQRNLFERWLGQAYIEGIASTAEAITTLTAERDRLAAGNKEMRLACEAAIGPLEYAYRGVNSYTADSVRASILPALRRAAQASKEECDGD